MSWEYFGWEAIKRIVLPLGMQKEGLCAFIRKPYNLAELS